MANFYSNDLSIAAPEESMKNVLRIIAHNLRTRRAATWFDEDTDSLDSVLGLYRAVYSEMDAYYWLVFTPFEGAPGDEEGAGESGTDGLSDTACISLQKDPNNRYVLGMRYSTRWGSNEDEVHAFIESFPEGEYGYALLGASEGDGFWETSMESGYTTGGRISRGGRDFIVKGADEVIAEKARIATDRASEETDLAKLAYKCGLSGWFEYETMSGSKLAKYNAQALHDGPSFLDEFEYAEFASFSGRASFKRRKRKYLTDEERNTIVSEALGFIGKFPIECNANYYEWLRGKETLEWFDALVPGEEVGVGSSLMTPHSHAHLSFHLDAPGIPIFAYLDLDSAVLNGHEALTKTDKRSFALLIPWIKAVIEHLDPRVFLDDEDNYSLDESSKSDSHMRVRFELKEIELGEMLEGLRERANEGFAAGNIELEEDA